MRELARAVELTVEMREALDAEILRARAQRLYIRRMDSEALLETARKRAAFNAQMAHAEGELAGLLGEIKGALGLAEITLETLALRAPVLTAPLRERLGEVRALAQALRELDLLNQQLAERALLYVKSYAGAILPRISAYDRRGAATPGEPLISTASRTV
jgi:hypothetical protein